MKLMRMIVLLAGVLFVLPSPPEDDSAKIAAAPGSFALVSAASEAFGDAQGFCERQRRACDTADYLASRVQAKARYSFKLAYEWANGGADPVLTDDIATASVTPELKPSLE
jgi:hypothetical protein